MVILVERNPIIQQSAVSTANTARRLNKVVLVRNGKLCGYVNPSFFFFEPDFNTFVKSGGVISGY